MLKKLCGIYAIVNKINGKCYVGSSKNIESRIKNHFNLLKKNNHHSNVLQKSFNKGKGKNLFVEIIEMCKEKDLFKKEQFWIDYYNSSNSEKGYNILPVAGSIAGVWDSQEARKKCRKKIANRRASKYKTAFTEEEIFGIRYDHLLGIKRDDICKKYSVEYSIAGKIIFNDIYQHKNIWWLTGDQKLQAKSKLPGENKKWWIGCPTKTHHILSSDYFQKGDK